VAYRANQVDGFVTAFGFHLPHHAPNVILHREFRQVQAGGNSANLQEVTLDIVAK
jgi:hypothetical protein